MHPVYPYSYHPLSCEPVFPFKKEQIAECLFSFLLKGWEKERILAEFQTFARSNHFEGEEGEIAIRYAPFLLNALQNIAHNHSILFRDPLLYYKYISPTTNYKIDVQDFVRRVAGAIRLSFQTQFGYFLELIFWMQLTYIRDKEAVDLAQQVLDLIFSEPTHEKKYLMSCLPPLFDTLKARHGSCLFLDSGRGRKGDANCCTFI